MTKDQIKYAIETGEMKLSNRDKLNHYRIVGFLFFIPALFIFFHLQDYFQGTQKAFQGEKIWFIIIPSILGLLFYKLQKNKLKFNILHTNITREEFDPIVEKIANELEWKPYVKNKKIIIAKTHPGFLSGSWGEQITILFDQNRILVNSICDPSKQSSVVSMGRNKQNVNRLVEEIKKANN